MSSKKNTNLKNLILKSGLPLELSVLKKLKEIGLKDIGAVEYERDSPDGLKYCSADRCFRAVANMGDEIEVYIDLIVECKYKTENQEWYFVKFDEDDDSSTGSNQAFLEIPYEFFKQKNLGFNFWELEAGNLFNLPAVDDGVEISKGKSKEIGDISINKALNQASFASIKRQYQNYRSLVYNFDLCWKVLDLDIKKNDFHPFLLGAMSIPIVVTNANIYVPEEDATLEKIKKSKDVDSLFSKVDGVAYRKKANPDIKEYMGKLLNSDKLEYEEVLWEYCKSSSKDSIYHSYPGWVYIINYEHLKDVFRNGLWDITKLLGKLQEFSDDY